MPDWFYRTVSQPILFRLPAPRARDFALGFIGRLARLPLGPYLIDFLGHMRADPRLRQTLQLLLLGVHARLGVYMPATRPDFRGDRAWRLSLWGQLLLVVHGFVLLGAGVTISLIGITSVFVHSDLEFLGTTAGTLLSANPRLVPLVAHDRATLGGMLLASGWLFLLSALWGYRRGASWLWWILLTAGIIAYAAAILVHYSVGYLSFMHLLPAFGGFALLLIGSILSCPFLCQRNSETV